MDPDPAAAKEIFYAGEIGRTEDAGAIDRAQQDLQRSVAQNQAIHIEDANKQTLAARIAADQSSALPPFVFL